MNALEIASLRQRLGLTLVEMARKIGVHPATIGKWEGGYTRPIPYFRHKLEALAARHRETKAQENGQDGAARLL